MHLTEEEKRRIEEERQIRHLKTTAELLQENQKYDMSGLLSFFIPIFKKASL